MSKYSLGIYRKTTNKKLRDRPFFFQRICLSLLIFATLFLGIGYANISGVDLGINGSAQAKVQDGVFISDALYYSNNNALIDESSINNYFGSTLNTTVYLSESDTTSSITYQITVYNNSDYDYYFSEVMYSNDFYDNTDIVFELTGLEINDLLKSKSSLTFYITFKYGDIDSINSNVLNSYLNFDFIDGDDVKNQTIAVDEFYLFLFDNATQIEYEDSPFWGAFVLENVRQDINDDTLFYISLDTVKSIYKEYMGVDIIIDGDEPDHTIMDSASATDPLNNRKEVTYVKIDGETFIAITDTTGYTPNRTNMYIVNNELNTTEVDSFYLFLYNNETLIYADPTPFYGAFELTDVLQNTDFPNTFYIPVSEIEEIYYTYIGTDITIKDNPNITVKYPPSAYRTDESYRKDVTYKTINDTVYIRIEDTTGLTPNRSNIFIQAVE